jgi:hypothetical protein
MGNLSLSGLGGLRSDNRTFQYSLPAAVDNNIVELQIESRFKEDK